MVTSTFPKWWSRKRLLLAFYALRLGYSDGAFNLILSIDPEEPSDPRLLS